MADETEAKPVQRRPYDKLPGSIQDSQRRRNMKDLSLEKRNWIALQYEDLPKTQLALLDAAAEAFTAYGFAAASIDLIARQIGATKGSVYYHYRSKADLFFAVHKRAMVTNLRTVIPLLEDDSIDDGVRLHRMAYAHALLMMQNYHYQRVTVQGVELHQSISTTPEERDALAEVIAMRDAYEGLFKQVVRSGVAKKIFAKVNSSLAAKSILGSLNWVTIWYRPRDGELPRARARIARELAALAVSGVLLRER